MKYIDGYVQINNLYLKEIPEILNGVHIKGDFDVSFNILKSLNNSPVKVDGVAEKTINSITSKNNHTITQIQLFYFR